MPQFVKMGIGTQGYMPKAGSSLRAKARRAARRIVMPGYPRHDPFVDGNEIEKYFAGDRIECLLCGRLLGSLGSHLRRIHGINEDNYRQRYGLPWRRGLTGSISHARYIASGHIRDKEHMRALSREFQPIAARAPHKPKTPIQLTECKSLILQASGLVEYGDLQFDRFLAAVATGMTPREVAALPNMPRLTTWHRKRRDDADYEACFQKIWEALPFPVQARAQMLGTRFEKECERLFHQGKFDWQIADLLGVTTMSVNKRTRKWRGTRKAA